MYCLSNVKHIFANCIYNTITYHFHVTIDCIVFHMFYHTHFKYFPCVFIITYWGFFLAVYVCLRKKNETESFVVAVVPAVRIPVYQTRTGKGNPPERARCLPR